MHKNLEILATADGSYTLFNPEMDETYHSRNGAWSESQFVYIEKGLQSVPFREVKVLEVGFGTGTNAILSYLYAQKFYFKVEYTTLEPFPLDWEMVKKMQFDNKLSAMDWEVFKKMHTSAEQVVEPFGAYFSFEKQYKTLENFNSKEQYDLVYFDAFAPSKQEEIWALANIQKLYNLMTVGGKLVTYCAQGQFKRNLKEAGFLVENPPGPHHKKEMTVASKV